MLKIQNNNSATIAALLLVHYMLNSTEDNYKEDPILDLLFDLLQKFQNADYQKSREFAYSLSSNEEFSSVAFEFFKTIFAHEEAKATGNE